MPSTTPYINTTLTITSTSSDSNQRYPVVLSSNAEQSLSAVLLKYSSGDTLLSFYSDNSMTAYDIINNAFNQANVIGYIGGVDLETTFDIDFSQDGTLDFSIELLDADDSTFTDNLYDQMNMLVSEQYREKRKILLDYKTNLERLRGLLKNKKYNKNDVESLKQKINTINYESPLCLDGLDNQEIIDKITRFIKFNKVPRLNKKVDEWLVDFKKNSKKIFGIKSKESEVLIKKYESIRFNISKKYRNSLQGSYSTYSGTADSIADLADYINTNFTTVTAAVDGTTLTITPNVDTPNQLFRISFSNLNYSDYPFTGYGVAADIPTTLNALIFNVSDMLVNYYAFYTIGSLFFPLLEDSDTDKIAYQVSNAQTINDTDTYGDYAKIIFQDTADTANYTTSTSCLSYQCSTNTADAGYSRNLVCLSEAQEGVSLGLMADSFAATNGNSMKGFTGETDYTAGSYSDTQVNQMLDLSTDGLQDSNCNICNYYAQVQDISPFYYGVIGSNGQQMVFIIVGDNLGVSIRQNLLTSLRASATANNGNYTSNYIGISTAKTAILSVLSTYYNDGYIQAYSLSGGSYSTDGDVLSGITVNFTVNGYILKIYVSLNEFTGG